MNFYEVAELQEIVERGARLLEMNLTNDGAREIAKRSRGTPRVSGRLLRRVRDYAFVDGAVTVDAKAADAALVRLGVDASGLDTMDRRYLSTIAEHYAGGPVGVETLAAALAEQRDVLEEVIEPYLIQQGLLQRTPRGRMLAAQAWRYLGLDVPITATEQLELLRDGGEVDDG
jgi:Holliday junction DNA helicase RuvB